MITSSFTDVHNTYGRTLQIVLCGGGGGDIIAYATLVILLYIVQSTYSVFSPCVQHSELYVDVVMYAHYVRKYVTLGSVQFGMPNIAVSRWHKSLSQNFLQCTDTLAVRGFIQHVTNRSEVEIIIIGAGCSVSTQPVAALAPFWNLVQVRHIKLTLSHCLIHSNSLQISPGSASPRLSDRHKFPTFLRTYPSLLTMATGIVKLMKLFNWKHVAIITQEEDLFTLVNIACLHCLYSTCHYIHTILHISINEGCLLYSQMTYVCPFL